MQENLRRLGFATAPDPATTLQEPHLTLGFSDLELRPLGLRFLLGNSPLKLLGTPAGQTDGRTDGVQLFEMRSVMGRD